MANERKTYKLRNKDGVETATFKATSPRQAALKVANRGYTDILLRETGRTKKGTWRVHIFKGEKISVKMDVEKLPKFLRQGKTKGTVTINKPNVKKIRMEHIKEI